MRLLLDKNLSFRLVAMLESHGHGVVHVDDLDLEHADDDVILNRARELDRIVVSSDTDFGALLAAQRRRVRRWCSPARSRLTPQARSPSCCWPRWRWPPTR